MESHQPNQDLKSTIFEQNKSPILQTKYDALDAILEQMRLAIGLVARLRGPHGCPWDREQNHLTVRPYLIEEAYEVLDVLDTYESKVDPKQLAKNTPLDQEVPADGNLPAASQTLLKEELGDLLLQVLLHAQFCWERGEFNVGDVAEFMTRKLVSRHPHVFGGSVVEGSDQVLANWETIKKKEGRKGVLSGLPKNMPSLQRGARVGEKAKGVGFDWRDISGVWAKVEEEMQELKEARESKDQDAIEHEIGDLFFSLCSLARWHRIQPEDAHRKAIGRFENRFNKVEEYFETRKLNMQQATEEELDQAWNWAKTQTK